MKQTKKNLGAEQYELFVLLKRNRHHPHIITFLSGKLGKPKHNIKADLRSLYRQHGIKSSYELVGRIKFYNYMEWE